MPATSVFSPTDSPSFHQNVLHAPSSSRLLETPVHRTRRRLLVRDGDVTSASRAGQHGHDDREIRSEQRSGT